MISFSSTQRKRVNFMVSTTLLEELTQLVPAGERSDFVNTALEDQLTRLSRKIAFEKLAKMNKKAKIKASTEKILKEINHGRE